MKRVVRLLVRAAVVLLVLVAVVAAAVWFLSQRRIDRTWTVEQGALAFDRSPEALAEGRHLVETRGCTECHGADLGGAVLVDDPAMGLVYSPNITSGKGGVVSSYNESDWVRTIRHGVAPSGRSLLIMPTEDYYFLDDRDVARMIVYLEQVPPVDRESRSSKVGPVARALLLAGKMPLLSAEKVDHGLHRPAAPPRGATTEYGHYVARSCIGCHREDFTGGRIASGPPGWPAAANLTPHEKGLADWTEADFFRALREGMRPDGTRIDPVMPRMFGNMTDEELRAIWLYLRTVEPRPDGV